MEYTITISQNFSWKAFSSGIPNTQIMPMSQDPGIYVSVLLFQQHHSINLLYDSYKGNVEQYALVLCIYLYKIKRNGKKNMGCLLLEYCLNDINRDRTNHYILQYWNIYLLHLFTDHFVLSCIVQWIRKYKLDILAYITFIRIHLIAFYGTLQRSNIHQQFLAAMSTTKGKA